jgi:hypothetical protein
METKREETKRGEQRRRQREDINGDGEREETEGSREEEKWTRRMHYGRGVEWRIR